MQCQHYSCTILYCTVLYNRISSYVQYMRSADTASACETTMKATSAF